MENIEKETAKFHETGESRNRIKGSSNWYVYLLRCADGSLYCGTTVDIGKRLKAHNSGTASKYTRSRRPLLLSLSVGPMPKSEALKLEIQTKRLPRHRKIAFLSNKTPAVSLGPAIELSSKECFNRL